MKLGRNKKPGRRSDRARPRSWFARGGVGTAYPWNSPGSAIMPTTGIGKLVDMSTPWRES